MSGHSRHHILGSPNDQIQHNWHHLYHKMYQQLLTQEMKIAHFKNHGLMLRTEVLVSESNISK